MRWSSRPGDGQPVRSSPAPNRYTTPVDVNSAAKSSLAPPRVVGALDPVALPALDRHDRDVEVRCDSAMLRSPGDPDHIGIEARREPLGHGIHLSAGLSHRENVNQTQIRPTKLLKVPGDSCSGVKPGPRIRVFRSGSCGSGGNHPGSSTPSCRSIADCSRSSGLRESRIVQVAHEVARALGSGA